MVQGSTSQAAGGLMGSLSFPPGGGNRTRGATFRHVLKALRASLLILLLGTCAASDPGFTGHTRLAAPSPVKIDGNTGFGGTEAAGQLTPSEPGPWGQLEVIRISTEPPEEYIVERFQYEPTQWIFPDYTRDRIVSLFKSAGLDKARQQALWKRAQLDPLGTGWIFRPDADLVISLSAKSRQVIYTALGKYEENIYQCDPFRWRTAALDEWFVDGGLSDATINLIKKLLYYRGQSALFADPGIVMATLPRKEDRVQVLKTLIRQSTLLIKLKIQPDTNVDLLTAYWGQHNRSRDISTLLHTLARVKEGCSLDIIHLLPRFARMRLYTYPVRSKEMISSLYDCHWSSMNFWNDPPDDRLGEDHEYRIGVLKRDYDLVKPPYEFGDLLFLINEKGEAFHSTVYIADDIVFTKNGPTITSPWIFMKMDRMLAYYETQYDLRIMAYRLKPEIDSQ